MSERGGIYYDWNVKRWRDRATGRFVKTPKGGVWVSFALDYRSGERGKTIHIDAYAQDKLRVGETPEEARDRLVGWLYGLLSRKFNPELIGSAVEKDFRWEYDPYHEFTFRWDVKYSHKVGEEWQSPRHLRQE